MDDLAIRALGLGIAALIVGVFGWVRLSMKRGRAESQLATLGARRAERGDALTVPPSMSLISAPATPAWSAAVTRSEIDVGIYPLTSGFLVYSWRSKRKKKSLRFALHSDDDESATSNHPGLQRAALKGASVYGAPRDEVETFFAGRGAGVLARFCSSCVGRGWTLTFDGGVCHLTRDLVVETPDAMLDVVVDLERALLASRKRDDDAN